MSNKKEQADLIGEKMDKICKISDGQPRANSATQTNANIEKRASKTSLANNNDDSFISEYPADEPEPAKDGRISGGSNQSSGSSAFYDDSQEYSPSSGRSSALEEETNLEAPPVNQERTSKVLNPISNLPEQSDKFYEMVDKIRLQFLNTFQENQEASSFELADLEELRKPLPPMSQQEESLSFRLISRYLTNNKLFEKKGVEACKNEQVLEDCVRQAVENLTGFLKFRNQYKLTNVLEEEFSREFYIMSGAFVFGHDRQNIPIFYLRARVHRRWSKGLDEAFRRYLSWQLNKITKSDHSTKEVDKSKQPLNGIQKDGSFGICFDCAEVGYACLDMDFLRFIINLLIHYYPTYCRYALCVDLPWLFRSVWKLARSWLPEDARETVQLITSKQLTDFIDEDQIPNSFRINDLKASEKPIANKHSLPQNWSSIKGIDELGEEMNLSSNEIKQFKAHVEKLRKEYESLGAL